MSQKKSVVWDHFQKTSKSKVICKHCGIEIKFCGNTTNLWNHAAARHKIKNNKIADEITDTDENSDPLEPTGATSPKRPKLGTIDKSFQEIQSYRGDGIRNMKLNDALMYMVVKDHMPLLTPERAGFKYFMKCAQPLYKPPCRKTLTRMLQNKYEVLAERVKRTIKELESYCLTVDIWTNTSTSKSYFGVTLHYYNNEKNMQSITIGVHALDDRHTASYIGNTLLNICHEWLIDMNRISIIVTDNAENMVKAVKDTFGKAKHLPCFAHTLNLLAQDVLGTHKVNGVKVDNVEGIPPLINKVKSLITFFKRSVNMSDSLRKLQYESGETEGSALRLIQDIDIRWNSTYMSLKRFLELSDEIGITLLKHADSPSMLTGAELETIKLICELLAPLFQITEEISAEKVPTAAKVIPLLYLAKSKISSTQIADLRSVVKKMKDRLLSQFDIRFGNVERVRPLALATLLDPRFKKLHFTNSIAVAEATNVLHGEISDLCIDMQMDSIGSNQPCQSSQRVSKYENDLWTIHDDLAIQKSMTPEENGAGKALAELRQYFILPVADRNSNPYETWNSLKSQFPNVYKLAIKHLSIVSTSVPAERLFSETGLIATDLRNRLTSSNLSMLVFLSSIDEALWVQHV